MSLARCVASLPWSSLKAASMLPILVLAHTFVRHSAVPTRSTGYSICSLPINDTYDLSDDSRGQDDEQRQLLPRDDYERPRVATTSRADLAYLTGATNTSSSDSHQRGVPSLPWPTSACPTHAKSRCDQHAGIDCWHSGFCYSDDKAIDQTEACARQNQVRRDRSSDRSFRDKFNAATCANKV